MSGDQWGEYLRAKEPGVREKAYAWKTAIGLQKVDGLTPTEYLVETARRNIEGEISIEEVKKLAIKAFKAIDGTGIARVDFFIEKDTNKIYINEINTMPGFTEISMYPKLFESLGMQYSELLDKLIQNAIK